MLADPSLWVVAAGNLFAIAMALVYRWDMGEVMFIYWTQSVIIGLVNAWRIFTLKEFSVEGMQSNGRPLTETAGTKISMGLFFMAHYGLFHLVYFMAMQDKFALSLDYAADTLVMVLCMAMFFGVHGYSFHHNRRRDFRDAKPHLGTLMMYPYMRIVPMHLTVMFGMMTAWGLILFMALKTGADCAMHVIEHSIFRRPERRKN